MNNPMWRYGLTEDRYRAVQWWCRGEALRCVATRRVASRTGVVSGSGNLEKTGSIAVKSRNRWLVFRCTVNWARARLKTALIADGATGSSAVYAAGVRKCVAAGEGSSVLRANEAGGVDSEACVVRAQRDAGRVFRESFLKQ
ncbi:hypothetical protein [Gimesia sp.]|uniref:hypothetical protein n=2 Tax=Gimesia TaxID=1649453 RepID=UPI0025C6FCDB|nr:hypothetical protein [Gimesia sp.]